MAHCTAVSDFYDVGHATGDDRGDAIADAVSAIRDEHLIVLPTDTVYGIAADAFSVEAVAQLLATKGRSRRMPPPVLVADVRTVDGVATEVSDDARALMRAFWPGKLTVVLWAQPTLRWDLGDTEGTVAVRVPGHALAVEILRQTGPLAVSSANRTGQPAATTAAQAREQLGKEVSVYLEDGVSCADPSPSTIVDCTAAIPAVLRLGAISVQELRQVSPQLLDADGNGPDEDSNMPPLPLSPAGSGPTQTELAASTSGDDDNPEPRRGANAG